MKSKGRIITLIVIAIITAVLIFVFFKHRQIDKYRYDDLKAMNSEKLLKVFVDNGLNIEPELKKKYSEEELANMIKDNFDLLTSGVTNIDGKEYKEFAKNVKTVYDKITDEKVLEFHVSEDGSVSPNGIKVTASGGSIRARVTDKESEGNVSIICAYKDAEGLSVKGISKGTCDNEGQVLFESTKEGQKYLIKYGTSLDPFEDEPYKGGAKTVRIHVSGIK